MNPFARALQNYHLGDTSAKFHLLRDDGFEQKVPASVFFDDKNFPSIEDRAMNECRGRVLDVGGAAGRHSLELRRRGFFVTTLDILSEMEPIMRDRGLTDVVIGDVLHDNISSTFDQRFDTLLMLMNGIGMVGREHHLSTLLSRAEDLLATDGQIICDSIDVTVTKNPQHVLYREQNLAHGQHAGQQSFSVSCDGAESIQFDWLHIDFPTLSTICSKHGWQTEQILADSDGHYLCKITRQP